MRGPYKKKTEKEYLRDNICVTSTPTPDADGDTEYYKLDSVQADSSLDDLSIIFKVSRPS